MALSFDPENFLKLRKLEEEDVLRGRIPLKAATTFAEGSRVENGHIVEPGDTALLVSRCTVLSWELLHIGWSARSLTLLRLSTTGRHLRVTSLPRVSLM
jgi:hypothetical protein